MEKLNIKLLLNAIAADEMTSVESAPIRDESLTETNNSSLQEMYSDLERSLDQEDGFHASLFGFLNLFNKKDRCFGQLVRKLSSDKSTLRFLKSGVRNQNIEGVSVGSLKAIEAYVKELIQFLKDNNCYDSLPIGDIARELAKIFGSRGRAAEVIKNVLNGVKNMADGFGEILAGIRPDLVRQYAATVAASNAQLAQQCAGGLSAAESALLIVGAVALVAAVVYTGGLAAPAAAKLLAVGGGLAVCGTAMSADDLASAGEEAARLEREYFDAANTPNAEEEYIDNVLDPSGLSDVSNYPGNPGR